MWRFEITLEASRALVVFFFIVASLPKMMEENLYYGRLLSTAVLECIFQGLCAGPEDVVGALAECF
jgi:hypothetical protein